MSGNRKKRFLLKRVAAKAKLDDLIEGLIYISETDAEFSVFRGKPTQVVDKNSLSESLGLSSDVNVEEREFNDFFERFIKINDWYGDEEKKTAARFLRLKEFLQSNFSSLKVFKVGRINIDVYIVGLDKDGVLSGIKTEGVET